MTEERSRRRPQAFDPKDPRVAAPTADDTAEAASAFDGGALPPGAPRLPARIPITEHVRSGIRWGAILASAAAGLLVMALALRFWTFVWGLLERDDWIGWTALVLAAILGLACVVLLVKEVVGFFRLARLKRLRTDAELALANKDKKLAEHTVSALRNLYAGRPELAWARSRYGTHAGDVMDGPERLALADRELLAPVDDMARGIIAQSAKRISIVTAITPYMVFDMGFVLYENFRMLRRVAAVYGGRPGFAGSLRLAGMVLTHLVATGGIAMTDDLFGQFVSQGIAQRLSARAGEGMFNGALTARVGLAAIDVIRPLPFIAAERPRFRDLAGEVAKGFGAQPAKAADQP